jgi:hypothetical protein
VDRLQRLIEEVERRARRLVDAALDAFDLPPRGSMRWLEVEVPRP